MKAGATPEGTTFERFHTDTIRMMIDLRIVLILI